MTAHPGGQAETLLAWIAVPIDDGDVSAWAGEQGRAVAERCDLAAGGADDVAAYLTGVANLPRPGWVEQRLVFLAHPALGAAVWDVSAFDPALDTDAVVAMVSVGHLSHEVTNFEHLGISGGQALSFETEEEQFESGADNNGSAIAGAAILAVSSAGEAPTTLVARCRTIHLEALAASVPSMQYLLCSEAGSAAGS